MVSRPVNCHNEEKIATDNDTGVIINVVNLKFDGFKKKTNSLSVTPLSLGPSVSHHGRYFFLRNVLRSRWTRVFFFSEDVR